MEKIFNLADRISSSIKQSDIYNNYLISKELLKEEKELSEKIKQFKIKNYEFQLKLIQNETVSFDEEKYVSSLYFDLMRNSKSKNFLENEMNMIKLMSSIYIKLSTDCRIELEL